MDAGSDLGNDYSQLSEQDIQRIRSILYNQRARPAPDQCGVNLG